ncbi:MAG TPA: C1 family peptidase [Burkholderiaceae bacterium]|nr:C1 family peptidase [Burkholderiaceae bacterium]
MQERYEPETELSKRLGNTEPGDGKRFRGRGPIQLTGRANYKRFGALLRLDLEGCPEQASAPDAGFRIAGLFWQKKGLNELADAGNFKEITRRINGGLNGLAQREKFHALALEALSAAFPAGAVRPALAANAEPELDFDRGAEAIRAMAQDHEGAGRGKEAPVRNGKIKEPGATRPKLDARRDTMDFRDLMYVPTLIEVPSMIRLGDYLEVGVPILDQGHEGACTGYGLATVANYLLRRRHVVPDCTLVSARMLYDLARRYDEWPGEDYEGSSGRGAMKGWHKHGVCPEDLYPSRHPDRKGLTKERTSEASKRPLGAYFRVNHQDLVAMHSAIAEVGILYTTCAVHEGWFRVDSSGVIEMREDDKLKGGHAFAIVAYDEEGFWLQNSWGPTWGRQGFGRISYDDWLRNGTDVWVARLGAPVTLRSVESTAAAHAATAGESIAYTFAALRPHIVSVGNDGRLRAGGDYGVTTESLAHVFDDDIRRVTRDWDKVRILLYAHGGLVNEAAAVQRLAEYRPSLLQGRVYPLAFIWRSDYWTTLTNILEDAVRRRRPEGVLDATKDFLLDRIDDALEPVARALTGKSAWDEMKENALDAGREGGAAWLVARHLKEKVAGQPWLQGRKVEIHLVGHSAGSILHAGLVPRLLEQGLHIESCTLWAPACTIDLFNEYYLPALKDRQIGRLALYVLSDKAERDDNCARIYNKSLLYLVSNAFEERFRIPGIHEDRPFREGVPILGMQRWLDDKAGAAVKALFAAGSPHLLVVAPNNADPATGSASQARHHGDFDDDQHTVLSSFNAILGLDRAAKPSGGVLKFHRNAGSLRERRLDIEAGTGLDRQRR